MVYMSTNNNIVLGDCFYNLEKNPYIKLIKYKFNKNTKLKTIGCYLTIVKEYFDTINKTQFYLMISPF